MTYINEEINKKYNNPYIRLANSSNFTPLPEEAMPTIKVNISPYERSDGRFQVRIRIIQNQKAGFIKTPYYVESSDVDRNGEIIPLGLRIELNNRIRKIEKKMYELGDKLDTMAIHELIEYLEGPLPSEINLISYFRDKIDTFKHTKAKQTVSQYHTALDRFVAFYGEEILEPGTFTVRLLNDFEIHLRTVPGKMNKVTSSTTIRLYQTYLCTLANIAEREDVLIRNPYRKGYIKPKANVPDKRNLDVDTIRKLLNDSPTDPREVFAHDVFKLSLSLAGMNTADMYSCSPARSGRIEYNRQKTKRRSDKAFTSIMVQPEIKDLVLKYADKTGKRQFNFYKLYNSTNQFNKRVNKGLSLICERLKIDDVTTYHARHTFASIARNECNIAVDDVDLALVHKDNFDMTDKYTKVDFTKVDRAVRAVLDYIFETKGGMKVVKLAN